MKNITVIFGVIFLVANLLFGAILSAYPTFNVWLNSGVIVATTALLYVLKCITLKDGYYISLYTLFAFLGIVEFALGLFAPEKFENNWYLIAIILTVGFEAIMLAVTHTISKTIK